MTKVFGNMRWIIVFSLILIPIFSSNRYLQDIVIMTFLWAGLACSWNINCGYCKRLSIGHGAFLGIGAYTSTILFMNFGISPWIGMIIGGCISALIALVLGKATLRLKGSFFVLATIAFAEILRIFVMTSRNITAGSMGLLIPYEPGFANMIWSGKIPYAIITWVYMIILLFISVKLEKSKFGYYLISIGEDRDAAETLGVNSTRIMVISFVQSAFLTSIGGSIFAQYIMFLEPHAVMGLNQSSLQFILIGIIGGMGTAFGPFVGALILMPLSILLRGYFADISGLHGLMYGLILLFVVLLKPEGLIIQVNKIYMSALKKIRVKGVVNNDFGNK